MADTVLPAILPNAGIQARYESEIKALVTEMQREVLRVVSLAYGVQEPEPRIILARDANPATVLRGAFETLRRVWLKRFRDLAPKLAGKFVRNAAGNFDATLMRDLRNAGWTVQFQQTAAVKAMLAAKVTENVALIRSIPEQYLATVEQATMRSVAAGRDLQSLTDEITATGQVTRHRAARIALDQNNKATAAITRTRRLELGLTTAIWMHSHAGRHPRPAHVAMNGKEFNIAKGMWDPDERAWIQPGELINCRCTSRVVIPGLVRRAQPVAAMDAWPRRLRRAQAAKLRKAA